ncbi:unnamed protein product [Medioppia subpectinata]|uniref:BZIP domain-containing protein n=1 Tax=Medioppia subpectinata TaxID=1979941 RepID=A0A7R9L1N1_9ACAR|nr:unnamed protein product [Medioppia subpectinata]CAG2113844.1 unnamed protein product [Medioppia subpectinata]
MSFLRIAKYVALVGVGGTSVHVLHQNHWDVRNVGAVRFGRAAVTVGRIAIDYKWSVSALKDTSPETLNEWSAVHQRSADRLLDLCCTNGGVFIKVGQHIAALEYLVPLEYINTLKVLHSRAPRSSLKDIKRVIKEDTGSTTEQLFNEFQSEPIGAASLAQVHKARLKDGRLVAVKVQHPHVKRHSYIDMKTMDVLVQLVGTIFPEFSFLWLAEETKRNLPLELDFINEGRNAERLARTFANFLWLKIPSIEWSLSSERLLVMEYVDGCQVTDKKYMINNQISCREVSHRLGLMYSQMIFIEGNVHCDPHPGNILVSKCSDGSPQIILLDHGLYTQLTEKFRHEYSRMWLAVINADVSQMKVWSKALGVGDLYPLLACIMTAKPWNAIQRGLDKAVDKETRKKESGELRQYASQYLTQISEVLAKVDRQMLLVFKTNDLLRSIDHVLGTAGERRSLITMSRSCIRAVHSEQLRHSNHCVATTTSTITSSQETNFSSQASDDCYQISSQEINTLNGIQSQEASNASEFILNLTSSQITSIDTNHTINSTGDDHHIHHTLHTDPQKPLFTDIKPKLTDCMKRCTDGVNDSINGCDVKVMAFEVEKRKRGRKRKIRTAEELELHLKDKKEKNRLAAQRLRQRKCSEGHRYDKEVEEYEKKIKIRRNFVQHLESSVQQLRDRITAMAKKNHIQNQTICANNNQNSVKLSLN